MNESRCAESMLADEVRDLVEAVAPEDELTARSAVETALYLLASGASVPEAYEETRRRVLSRLRHPSHVPWSVVDMDDGRPVDPVGGQV